MPLDGMCRWRSEQLLDPQILGTLESFQGRPWDPPVDDARCACISFPTNMGMESTLIIYLSVGFIASAWGLARHNLGTSLLRRIV